MSVEPVPPAPERSGQRLLPALMARPSFVPMAATGLGLVAYALFLPLGEWAWDGQARSLVVPQLLVLFPAAALAFWVARRRGTTPWVAPMVTLATFYATWAVYFVVWNILNPPVHG